MGRKKIALPATHKNIQYSTEWSEEADNGKRTKLVVYNLPEIMTEHEFGFFCGAIGEVESHNIRMNEEGGYGYGFVNYYKTSDAEVAFAKLNGHQLMDKTLRIEYDVEGYVDEDDDFDDDFDEDEEELEEVFSPHDEVSPNEHPISAKLYVSGLTSDTDLEMLEELFSPHGELLDTNISWNDDGISKSEGFVTFQDKTDAVTAMRNLQGFTDENGMKLHIEYATE